MYHVIRFRFLLHTPLIGWIVFVVCGTQIDIRNIFYLYYFAQQFKYSTSMYSEHSYIKQAYNVHSE